ncbi:MAG TPA: acyl carrier protein [Gemmatimonadaceae bacterium]|jgi:acyl carrier protein|nr:acyl carrier protein [Gemmatimonadaceae bacterium]
MTDSIRQIVQQHARLATPMDQLTDSSDLYQAGLTSHASVTLMLALEEAFNVEFPERMLRRRTFETMANIREAITELTQGQPVTNA